MIILILVARGAEGAAVQVLADSSVRDINKVSAVQGEFSSSRNGSKAPMPTRLYIGSIPGLARCSICDYVICLCSCLCYVQLIPDFGLM